LVAQRCEGFLRESGGAEGEEAEGTVEEIAGRGKAG